MIVCKLDSSLKLHELLKILFLRYPKSLNYNKLFYYVIYRVRL